MIESPTTQGRAQIIHDFDTLIIEIPTRKHWFIILFLTAWLGGWAMGEFTVITELMDSEDPWSEDSFTLFWLAGWTVGGIFALIHLLGQFTGREIIRLNKEMLSIQHTTLGIGFQKNYDVHSIDEIRINPVDSSGPLQWSWNKRSSRKAEGTMKFDYGMKTIHLAYDVDEAEAKMLIEQMKKYASIN